MKIERMYEALHLSRECLDGIEELLVDFDGERLCTIDLQFGDETLSVRSKSEFDNMTRLKGYPRACMLHIDAYQKVGGDFVTIFVNQEDCSIGHRSRMSVLTQDGAVLYKIIDFLEKLCVVSNIKRRLPNSQPIKSVFIAHSFCDDGKRYAHSLSSFLVKLGFNVELGDKFSPERVDEKVKRRILMQNIFMVIFSRKEDYTWLHQEVGMATSSNKVVIVLKEDGLGISEGILRGVDSLSFPKGCIEKTFVSILDGLEEKGYWKHQSCK